MFMKKFFLFKIFLVLFLLCGLVIGAILAGLYLYAGISDIEGDGNVVERKIDLDNLKEINVSIPAQIELIESKQVDRIEISGEKNILEEIEISEGENLEIKRKVKLPFVFPQELKLNEEIKIKIYVDTLEKISLSNNAKLYFSDDSKALTSEKLRVNLSDETELTLRVSTKNLEIDLDDLAKIKIIGFTDNLDLSMSGRSSAELIDLESIKVKVNLSDESEASIFAKDELEAKLNDESVLRYEGDPTKLKIENNDNSEVTKL